MTFFSQVVILQKNIIMVKVVDKKGKTHEVPEVMYQKQGANMGWTLVETDIVQTPTVLPASETMDFIEQQKAALEAPVVETVVPDETAALKAEIEKLKAELAKKECKPECKTIEVTATASDLLKKDEPEIPTPEPVKETPKPAAKKAPAKRRTTRKKTTK